VDTAVVYTAEVSTAAADTAEADARQWADNRAGAQERDRQARVPSEWAAQVPPEYAKVGATTG